MNASYKHTWLKNMLEFPTHIESIISMIFEKCSAVGASMSFVERFIHLNVLEVKCLTFLSCLTFSCSCFTCFCVFLSFLLWSPVPIYTHDPFPSSALPPPPPFTTTTTTTTSLCSGDCPEQRSGASWQRARRDLSLSGDHQWDLHSCACAKLAGGLPQSHPHHCGVCVATLSLSCSSSIVFLCSFHSVSNTQIYANQTYFLSIPMINPASAEDGDSLKHLTK